MRELLVAIMHCFRCGHALCDVHLEMLLDAIRCGAIK